MGDPCDKMRTMLVRHAPLWCAVVELLSGLRRRRAGVKPAAGLFVIDANTMHFRELPGQLRKSGRQYFR